MKDSHCLIALLIFSLQELDKCCKISREYFLRRDFKLRSDIVKKGATRCAHRSLFHANGYGVEELSRPLIGVCNSFNEIIPGHMHLKSITEAAKLGVAAAGGTPVEFPAIGVCDGIAMGHTGMKYSLASRELIAD